VVGEPSCPGRACTCEFADAQEERPLRSGATRVAGGPELSDEAAILDHERHIPPLQVGEDRRADGVVEPGFEEVVNQEGGPILHHLQLPAQLSHDRV